MASIGSCLIETVLSTSPSAAWVIAGSAAIRTRSASATLSRRSGWAGCHSAGAGFGTST